MQRIKRRSDAGRTAIQHMRVDHCRIHVAMAEQFLNRADVLPALEQVRGKRMPQCVSAERLEDSCNSRRSLDRPRQDVFVQVMPPANAAARIRCIMV